MNLLWVAVNERVIWPVITKANERKVSKYNAKDRTIKWLHACSFFDF